MKIDFHTKYYEQHFTELTERAAQISLEGLVMTGYPSEGATEVQTENGSLRIFPAQEIPWVATSKTKLYEDDYKVLPGEKPVWSRKNNHEGVAIAIFPEQFQLTRKRENISELISQVKSNNGIIYILHNDLDYSELLNKIDVNTKILKYNLDAYFIRPGKMLDKLTLHQRGSSITGSHSERAEDLKNGTGYTQFQREITDNLDLIRAIKNKEPKKLYIHSGPKHQLPIEDSSPSLKPNAGPFLRKIGWPV